MWEEMPEGREAYVGSPWQSRHMRNEREVENLDCQVIKAVLTAFPSQGHTESSPVGLHLSSVGKAGSGPETAPGRFWGAPLLARSTCP